MSLPNPGDRIATELLTEIFLHCATPRYDSVEERARILSLTHVCQHWRAAALCTSILWTHILFQPSSASGDRTAREVDCARAWLSRSGERLLSVFISTAGISRQSVITAFEVLMPHFPRWREFAGTLSPYTLFTLMGEAHQVLPPFTPQLRRLKLHFTDSSRDSAVSLRRIEAIPWFQITHLDIETYHPFIAIQILQYAPKIECLNIRKAPSTGPYESVMGNYYGLCDSEHPKWHTTHLALLSMTLDTAAASRGHQDDSSMLLSYLTLPALQTLGVPHDQSGPPHAFSLVKRSQCNLLSLKVHGRQSPSECRTAATRYSSLRAPIHSIYRRQHASLLESQ